MTDNSNNITCPNCGHAYNIESALSTRYEERLKDELTKERQRLAEALSQREAKLSAREQALEEARLKENELFMERLEREKRSLESQMKLKFQKDYDSVLEQKNRELKDIESQLLSLKQAEIENARLKRSLSQQKKDLELSFEQEMSERLQRMEGEISQRERSRLELLLKDKEKMLEDQKSLIEELKRKSEQRSGQFTGEVQELAIEEFLKQHFPIDTIDEVKKGARGADCIQIVNTRDRLNVGMIYYESKRSKEFQPRWIEKLREDVRQKGADVGVIVTQTMPTDMERMGIRNGMWICTYEEFKGLSFVLREMVVRLRQAVDAQENKGEKVEMLYSYLTSNEFRLQVEGILEGFTQMQDDLQRERNAMMRLWKQREKQIQKVLENTAGMFGSIKGIAGAALPDISLLELPDAGDE